jgi:hypothetical protein
MRLPTDLNPRLAAGFGAALFAGAFLFAGCGDDELAPVNPPTWDLTTVEGAISALEDYYSRQEANQAISLLAEGYTFSPALPESVPFFEPTDTVWPLDVEKDVLENMLVPERVSWLDQVLLEITIASVMTTPEGLKVVEATADLGLLEGNDTYLPGSARMQYVYQVDPNGNHLLLEEHEFLPDDYDPLNSILVTDQKVRVLPEGYDPDEPGALP